MNMNSFIVRTCRTDKFFLSRRSPLDPFCASDCTYGLQVCALSMQPTVHRTRSKRVCITLFIRPVSVPDRLKPSNTLVGTVSINNRGIHLAYKIRQYIRIYIYIIMLLASKLSALLQYYVIYERAVQKMYRLHYFLNSEIIVLQFANICSSE